MPQLRPTEKSELQLRGPFGGIQSELPLDGIEQLGFADSENIILRKARASVRPSFAALATLTDPIVGIADFFNVSGDRIQVVITTAGLFQWEPLTQAWTTITGTLTGGSANLFTWTVVNHKLLFCQGIDSVQEYDGVSGAFVSAFAGNIAPNDVVPARYMMELETHLLIGDVIMAATRYTQRTVWSRSGQPEDLDAVSAGRHDELGDLGPIAGFCKLYQTGYQFHQRGIVRIVPTGVALKPFDWAPISSNKIGNICPYSLASFGEYASFYVGKDNVYMFDGTQSNPIGARPMDGNRMFGARGRIFAELKSADLAQVSGFVTTSVAGNDFDAYHLVIPGGSHWVYNIDEGNWSRQTYTGRARVIGDFYSPAELRWLDLIGPWTAQAATWNDLAVDSPLSNMLIGFEDGTPGMVDFSGTSELPWLIQSGALVMGDNRHNKTILGLRIGFENLGPAQYNIDVRNERCQVETKCIEFAGDDCSPIITRIVPIMISGLYLSWKIYGNAGVPASFVEVTPIYDTGGEYKSPITAT